MGNNGADHQIGSNCKTSPSGRIGVRRSGGGFSRVLMSGAQFTFES
jgi:hypothetical protein